MSTVNKKEIEKFSKIAAEWWNPEGKFKPLHKFNPLRISYIKEKVIAHFNIRSKLLPFKNIELLDIGCGGGLLSEPMCRLGAKVTAIDASQKNINVASYHSNKNKLKINYLCSSPERLNLKKKFDVILNMEVVEHVQNIEYFIQNCSKIINKNGIMFIATINRTLKSYLQAIIGAEYILRWLPIGTHNWDNFFKPSELKNITEKNGFSNTNLVGIKFSPVTQQWKQSADVSVNYISTYTKI